MSEHGKYVKRWNRHCLRERREAAGLTVTELADRAQYTREYISKLENGQRSNPSLAVVGALAGALCCAITDLMTDEPSGAAA